MMEGRVTRFISGADEEGRDLEDQRAMIAACEGEDEWEQSCEGLVRTDEFLDSPLEETATV